MKTELISVRQEGRSDNGEIIADVAGSGFNDAEFASMLDYLKRQARCGNIYGIRHSITRNQVTITFELRGGDNSEVLTAMLAEMYLKGWCRDRDRAQAC